MSIKSNILNSPVAKPAPINEESSDITIEVPIPPCKPTPNILGFVLKEALMNKKNIERIIELNNRNILITNYYLFIEASFTI